MADAVALASHIVTHATDPSTPAGSCTGASGWVLARNRSGLRGIDANLDSTGVSVSCHDLTYGMHALTDQGRILGLHLPLLDAGGQYGPRNRTPSRCTRWSGSEAHQASVSQARSAR